MKSEWMEQLLNFDYVGRIRELMARQGLTQRDMCRRCAELGESTLPALFKKPDRIPTIRTVIHVCCALDVSLSEFFLEKDRDVLSPFEQDILDLFGKLPPQVANAHRTIAEFTVDEMMKK